jgi:hypothetical protein
MEKQRRFRPPGISMALWPLGGNASANVRRPHRIIVMPFPPKALRLRFVRHKESRARHTVTCQLCLRRGVPFVPVLGLRRHVFAGGWDGRERLSGRVEQGERQPAGGGEGKGKLKPQKLLPQVNNAKIQGHGQLIGQPQRASDARPRRPTSTIQGN